MFAASAVFGLFAACSLDLDESLIPSEAGAGAQAGAAGSGGGGTGGGGTGGTGGKIIDSGGACDADKQCETEGGCIEGRCATGTCVYEICPVTTACTARSCDTTASTCSSPNSFGFKAHTLPLDDEIGCSGIASRCVAGMDDYVFVGTTAGLLAYRVLSPSAPELINVQAPPFAITRMIATERRLIILGPTAANKLSIAWIDLPSDPLATDLTTSTAAVDFTDTYSTLYPADAGGFYLVQNSALNLYPSALLTPPLTNQTAVTLFPAAGLPSGQSVVAASGKRLVTYRTDTSGSVQKPTFGFVQDAGTSNAQGSTTEQSFDFNAPTSLGAHQFHSGYDGSLVWSTNRLALEDGGPLQADGVVLYWPLVGNLTTFDDKATVVVASYNKSSANAVLAGQTALISPSLAITTAAYPPDPQQTLVRSVIRNGTSLSLGTETPPVLSFAITQIGVTASRRFGFILTPSSTAPSLKTTLHIFAPGC
jgi:hypothetical protein